MTTRHIIVNGPSKFDLMLALFDGDNTKRRLVKFDRPADTRPAVNDATPVAKPLVVYVFDICINSIEREDGSGERWLFGGYYLIFGQPIKASGYYSTQTRQGWIDTPTAL